MVEADYDDNDHDNDHSDDRRHCSTAVAEAHDWNGLPPYIILLPLLSVFKRQLDTLHYSHSFDYY